MEPKIYKMEATSLSLAYQPHIFLEDFSNLILLLIVAFESKAYFDFAGFGFGGVGVEQLPAEAEAKVWGLEELRQDFLFSFVYLPYGLQEEVGFLKVQK